MLDDTDLGSVPDSSMISLFKGLIGFLSTEAQSRGWDDVSQSLKAVESNLHLREAAQDKSS
jgi:hypothetical protein